ncbi:helix-turn-helix transcriptional regulator [Kutzneria sp. NPDC051319]|uniref:helix-turn-helix domain-containing protein n=1 Tax=Kutzneria sp. NPDC051319 TaxID=3155047 RepID=UPI00343629D5
MDESFGELLRECRDAAGLSMGELSRRVNYSKGYLSKIENDLKPPNPTMAKLCDAALEAGGRLIEAARSPRTLDRRQVLAAGTMVGMALAAGSRPAFRPMLDDGVLDGMRASFENLRALGMRTSPVVVLDSLKAQVGTATALAVNSQEPTRSRLLLLAARIAEYTGWMSQEAGDDPGALAWTRRASELAKAGGDSEIESYAFVREAGLALYRHDPMSTIDLARQAQRVGHPSARIRGLALRREAQGHALAGDRYACDSAMDRAVELLSQSTSDNRYPVLGSTAPDPIGLARGWALCDLGRTVEAAEVLEVELARLPEESRRNRARFGARRSLAYALAGEIDQSCLTLAETLDDAARVDSATVRMDLKDLARTLGRWRGHRTVREIHPSLSRVLHRH